MKFSNFFNALKKVHKLLYNFTCTYCSIESFELEVIAFNILKGSAQTEKHMATTPSSSMKTYFSHKAREQKLDKNFLSPKNILGYSTGSNFLELSIKNSI